MSSLLIRDAAILTLDRAERYIERGDISVVDGRITAVHAHGETVTDGASVFDQVIDGRALLAAPGLVNAHTHSPGALLAGTMDTESHPAFMWLNQADTSGRTPQEVYVSAMLNAAQMLLAGVTTAIDHFPAQNFGPEDIAAAVRAYEGSGMRMVLAVRIFDDSFGDIFPRDMQLPPDLERELARVAPLPPKPLAQTRELTEDAIARYHAPGCRLSVFPAPTNPARCKPRSSSRQPSSASCFLGSSASATGCTPWRRCWWPSAPRCPHFGFSRSTPGCIRQPASR